MIVVNYSRLRQNLADVLDIVEKKKPVGIAKRGRPIAVMLSLEEYESYTKKKLNKRYNKNTAAQEEQIKLLANSSI